MMSLAMTAKSKTAVGRHPAVLSACHLATCWYDALLQLFCCCQYCCRWWLLPPQHTDLLQDRHGQLPADFFQLDGSHLIANTPQQQQQQQVTHPHAKRLLEVLQVRGIFASF
jgi:hypothetical protein